MNLELQPIFKKGDKLTHASLVPAGPVFVEVPGAEIITIAGENLIVGTLEFLLENQADRICGMYVTKGSGVHLFSNDDLNEMILDYDFGFGTNKFLSQLLEATNKIILDLSKKITKEIRKYKVRAAHFTHLVDDLERLSALSTLRQLKEVVKKEKASILYQDGTLFSRENRVRAIYTNAEPITEFIEIYKKDTSICQEGNLADSMFVLLEGKVPVTKEGRYIASITEPGEAFGELSLFLQSSRTASLTAEENTKLYVIKQANLVKFHRRYGDVFANVASTLATRIRDNIDRTYHFSEMLKNGPEVENESRIKLATFHELLIRMQNELHSEALKNMLTKYSVT